MTTKSFPELIGSGNPEAHDYAAGLKSDLNIEYKKIDALMKSTFIETTYTSKVERVAKAMAPVWWKDGVLGLSPKVMEGERNAWRKRARLAIDAMRD